MKNVEKGSFWGGGEGGGTTKKIVLISKKVLKKSMRSSNSKTASRQTKAKPLWATKVYKSGDKKSSFAMD